MEAQDKLFEALIQKPAAKTGAGNGHGNGHEANRMPQAAPGGFDGFLLPAGAQTPPVAAGGGKGRDEMGGVDTAMEILDKFQFA